MSLISWQPLRELDSLRQRINHLFDEAVHPEGRADLQPMTGEGIWAPAIELQETDSDVILKAELPGIGAKDLDIEVSQNRVSILGEHREEKHIGKKGFFYSEIRYGQFQRLISLPVPIKNDQVNAEFKEGVLTLTMPKLETERPEMVKIDLTTQEELRKAVTEQRQHEEHLQKTTHVRAAAEVGATTEWG
jgi:HSP20 family protein